MFGKKLIAALAALIFILGASKAMGRRVDSSATYNRLSDRLTIITDSRKVTVLAQNDDATGDDGDKSKSGSETSESKAVADDEKESTDAESKPLAPFVPSEKIPGEQAVDFPVDI